MSHYSRSLKNPQQAADDLFPPSTHPLRIGFIHPDLGIGGAERLVVDAAVGLKKLGHHVEIFTSWHDPSRCFEETRDGTLPVHVLGNSIFPRSIAGRFHTLLAIFRQLHLTLSLFLATLLSFLTRYLPASLVLPPSHPFSSSHDWSPRRSIEPFDVFFVDQLSACIPLLRWGLRTRVVFYCHFPDLLSQGSRGGAAVDGAPAVPSPAAALKALYRFPLDYIEQATTGEADKVLVNSEFTADIFRSTFPSLNRIPRCVYPGVDTSLYSSKSSRLEIPNILPSDRPTVLSINRLEDKKDLGLVVEAFALLRVQHDSDSIVSRARLVLIGGYDRRVADNVQTLRTLHRAVSDAGLTLHIWDPSSPNKPVPSSSAGPFVSADPPAIDDTDVLILLNAPSSHKLALLSSPETRVLAYTPSDEHLGIVPLEAMASGIPVLCTDSGGPRETVVDADLESSSPNPEGTGLRRSSIPSVWASALYTLLTLPPLERSRVSKAGRDRVAARFSLDVMSRNLERALRETYDVQRQGKRSDVWLEQKLWIGIMVASVPVLGACIIAWAFWREPDLLDKIARVFQVYEEHQLEQMRRKKLQ